MASAFEETPAPETAPQATDSRDPLEGGRFPELGIPFFANFWQLFSIEPEPLKVGDSATTYRVTRRDTKVPYVLKILHGVDPALLRDEVMALLELSAWPRCSPRVICYDAAVAVPVERPEGGLDFVYAVLTEYVEGTPLSALVADAGPLPQCHAAAITAALLDALAVVHRAGLAHRNVKLENAILTPDRRVVLTDFGLACVRRAREEEQAQAGADTSAAAATTAAPKARPGAWRPAFSAPRSCSASGVTEGDTGYLAPELLRGTPLPADIDMDEAFRAIDVYAVGIVAYALLSGSVPTAVRSVTTGEFIAPPGIADCFADWLAALLSLDPSARPDVDAARARLVACIQTIQNCEASWAEGPPTMRAAIRPPAALSQRSARAAASQPIARRVRASSLLPAMMPLYA
jgi:serine/threonine protein kinase